ncbi:MAG: transposase [Marinoscillum sp.]
MKLEERFENFITLVKSQFEEIDELRRRLNILEKENEALRRQLNQNSNNSRKPPSSDSIFNKADRHSKTKGGNKKRGG